MAHRCVSLFLADLANDRLVAALFASGLIQVGRYIHRGKPGGRAVVRRMRRSGTDAVTQAVQG
jgi:hypothetical protein